MTNSSTVTGVILIVIGIAYAVGNPTSNLPIILELAAIAFIIDGK